MAATEGIPAGVRGTIVGIQFSTEDAFHRVTLRSTSSGQELSYDVTPGSAAEVQLAKGVVKVHDLVDAVQDNHMITTFIVWSHDTPALLEASMAPAVMIGFVQGAVQQRNTTPPRPAAHLQQGTPTSPSAGYQAIITASMLLQQQEAYFDNRRSKGATRLPDFVLKANKNVVTWLDKVQRHSSPQDVETLAVTFWAGQWDHLWSDLLASPANWVDYRDWKVARRNPNHPDFKRVTDSEALWLNADFAHIVAALDDPQDPVTVRKA